MKFINTYKSSSFDKRKRGTSLKFIILHYTAIRSNIDTLNRFCDKKNKVSSHYLINKIGEIYRIVDINNRAWHAGKSFWNGSTDINSESIGIELDNSGHFYDFENYPDIQIKSLIFLIKYIFKKHIIDTGSILGHSDVAPYRKIDPCEKFPWYLLEKEKITFLPKKASKKIVEKVERYLKNNLKKNSTKHKTLHMLKKIGYNVNPAYKDNKKLISLIKSYQMHYRQNKISGKIDLETYKLIQSHYYRSIDL